MYVVICYTYDMKIWEHVLVCAVLSWHASMEVLLVSDS